MRMKLRPRYYCDFCRKNSGFAAHMAKHEKACTNNPARVCGVCASAELVQKPWSELLAALDEDIAAGIRSDEWEETEVGAACSGPITIPRLIDLAMGCPACILAAVRQRDAFDISFNYKKCHEEFWSSVNENRWEESEGSRTVYPGDE